MLAAIVPLARAAPTIQITSVPAYGTDGSMTGTVSGVDFAQYCVAPYIQIEGSGWWTKPISTTPTVTINSDGTFSANVTSGGVDDQATIYYAALVPAGSTPPLELGSPSAPVISNSVAGTTLERYGSTVQFAGYTWGVKQSSQPVGPGSNLFSSQNVWVDSQGQLHLQISQSGGQWYSAEAICPTKFGFGTYSFTTIGRIDNLDPNVTLGAFTWDPYGGETNGASVNREIDFEEGRWGNASDPTNAQTVVQPSGVAGNLQRFTIPALTDASMVTQSFTWKPGEVDFKVMLDSTTPPTLISESTYLTNPALNHYVPDAGNAEIHLNLWLNNVAVSGGGSPAPANGQPVQVVVSNFSFTPLPVPSAWAAAVDGNWSDTTKWTGAVPNGSGQTAVINQPTGTAATVTLDEAVTLGMLQLGNSGQSSSVGYTVIGSGGSVLTLSNSGGNPSQINVTEGTHAISAPISLAGSLSVSLSAAATLTLGGNISESATSSLTLSNGGTLILSGSNSYSGGTTVNSGVLVAENAAAIPSGSLLEIDAGGSLVLGMTGSAYVEGLGRIAGSPLGSQAPGTSGGALAPAAGDAQAGAPVHAVPEPGTLALLAVAAACGLAAAWRQRMKEKGSRMNTGSCEHGVLGWAYSRATRSPLRAIKRWLAHRRRAVAEDRRKPCPGFTLVL
jgi:autotransporter-associated beta strand protein